MTLSVASSSFAPNFKMKQDEYKKKKKVRHEEPKNQTAHTCCAHVLKMGWKKKRTWDKKKEINFLFNAGKLVSNICKTIFSCYGNSFAFFSRMFRIPTEVTSAIFCCTLSDRSPISKVQSVPVRGSWGNSEKNARVVSSFSSEIKPSVNQICTWRVRFEKSEHST